MPLRDKYENTLARPIAAVRAEMDKAAAYLRATSMVNGADTEEQIYFITKAMLFKHPLVLRSSALSLMIENYEPRMHSPPPDFIFEDAVDRAFSELPKMGGRADRPGAEHPATAREGTKRFPFIDSSAFASGDYRPDWLVKGVLVRNQPGVIAGPSKALKTNISIDLAVSLASGTPFLGEFAIQSPVKVAVVSGESGAHTLQETARRVCAARGLKLADLGANLQWCFALPTFSDLPGMVEYTKEVADLGAALNIVDPLYQSLGAVDARNLFEMGEALRAIGEMILKAGATPLLVHHANGRLQTGEVMELSQLSYTGLEQYVRQWLLINRQSKFRGDGKHDLTINIGGSAGQSKLLAVHIQEGVIDDHFAGRTWDVAVQSLSEAKEQEQDIRAEKKASKERDTERRHEAFVFDAIDAVTSGGQDAATFTEIKDRCPKLNTVNIKKALARLQEQGVVLEATFTKVTGRNREWCGKGYRRAPVVSQSIIPDIDGGTV